MLCLFPTPKCLVIKVLLGWTPQMLRNLLYFWAGPPKNNSKMVGAGFMPRNLRGCRVSAGLLGTPSRRRLPVHFRSNAFVEYRELVAFVEPPRTVGGATYLNITKKGRPHRTGQTAPRAHAR